MPQRQAAPHRLAAVAAKLFRRYALRYGLSWRQPFSHAGNGRIAMTTPKLLILIRVASGRHGYGDSRSSGTGHKNQHPQNSHPSRDSVDR